MSNWRSDGGRDNWSSAGLSDKVMASEATSSQEGHRVLVTNSTVYVSLNQEANANSDFNYDHNLNGFTEKKINKHFPESFNRSEHLPFLDNKTRMKVNSLETDKLEKNIASTDSHPVGKAGQIEPEKSLGVSTKENVNSTATGGKRPLERIGRSFRSKSEKLLSIANVPSHPNNAKSSSDSVEDDLLEPEHFSRDNQMADHPKQEKARKPPLRKSAKSFGHLPVVAQGRLPHPADAALPLIYPYAPLGSWPDGEILVAGGRLTNRPSWSGIPPVAFVPLYPNFTAVPVPLAGPEPVRSRYSLSNCPVHYCHQPTTGHWDRHPEENKAKKKSFRDKTKLSLERITPFRLGKNEESKRSASTHGQKTKQKLTENGCPVENHLQSSTPDSDHMTSDNTLRDFPKKISTNHRADTFRDASDADSNCNEINGSKIIGGNGNGGRQAEKLDGDQSKAKLIGSKSMMEKDSQRAAKDILSRNRVDVDNGHKENNANREENARRADGDMVRATEAHEVTAGLHRGHKKLSAPPWSTKDWENIRTNSAAHRKLERSRKEYYKYSWKRVQFRENFQLAPNNITGECESEEDNSHYTTIERPSEDDEDSVSTASLTGGGSDLTSDTPSLLADQTIGDDENIYESISSSDINCDCNDSINDLTDKGDIQLDDDMSSIQEMDVLSAEDAEAFSLGARGPAADDIDVVNSCVDSPGDMSDVASWVDTDEFACDSSDSETTVIEAPTARTRGSSRSEAKPSDGGECNEDAGDAWSDSLSRLALFRSLSKGRRRCLESYSKQKWDWGSNTSIDKDKEQSHECQPKPVNVKSTFAMFAEPEPVGDHHSQKGNTAAVGVSNQPKQQLAAAKSEAPPLPAAKPKLLAINFTLMQQQQQQAVRKLPVQKSAVQASKSLPLFQEAIAVQQKSGQNLPLPDQGRTPSKTSVIPSFRKDLPRDDVGTTKAKTIQGQRSKSFSSTTSSTATKEDSVVRRLLERQASGNSCAAHHHHSRQGSKRSVAGGGKSTEIGGKHRHKQVAMIKKRISYFVRLTLKKMKKI